jgi:pimeloyl-ACP methyl ester carboxylesterase
MANDAGKLTLNVETHGIGKGRPVIALHGFIATLESWRGLVPLLADRELWLFDLKGHGASPCPADGKYTVQDQADLVLARILEENMRDLTLIGHSFGGGVALLVGIELIKEGKGRLASLVLIDSLAFPEALSGWARLLRWGWPFAYAPVPLFALSKTAAVCTVRLALRILCRHPENITEAAIRAYARNLRPPERASALIQTGKNLVKDHYAGIEKDFNIIDVPTLIVWGRQDPLLPLEPTGSALHDGINGSRPVIAVDDCGHIAHEELPDLVLGQIAAFIAERGGSAH